MWDGQEHRRRRLTISENGPCRFDIVTVSGQLKTVQVRFDLGQTSGPNSFGLFGFLVGRAVDPGLDQARVTHTLASAPQL